MDEPGEVETKPDAGVESGVVDCEGGVDWAVVRSWRPSAAILSLRETVVMGTRCDLLKMSAHGSKLQARRCLYIMSCGPLMIDTFVYAAPPSFGWEW